MKGLRDKTAPQLLAERARDQPRAVAFRAKHLGLYRERTWFDYARLVARCAGGLRRLGMLRGERVAIMGDASEEWAICDLGAQAAGAITYGIYPTASVQELEFQMHDGGASIFVAENQEYVDKILPIVERLPSLRHIVVIDDSAMFAYEHAKLLPYESLIDGQEGGVDALERLAAELKPDDPAFIVYTSGNTGNPKGALMRHGAHLAGCYNLIEHYPALAKPDQRTVAYLPLCHILGRDVGITLPLLGGPVAHFGEDIEDLPSTLFEVAPTVLFTVPRYLQKFASQVLIGVGSTTRLKRMAYECAMRVGRKQAKRRWDGHAHERFAYRAARTLVFEPLLEKLGLDRLELVLSGGAPLPAETAALWQVWGVNVLEIYGQTEEAGAIITGQTGPFARPGSVGAVAPGWDLRLAEGTNEILIRGEHVFDGYWRNDEATREIKGDDGWLRTGDIGEWRTPGDLRLIDRARDFIVTVGGKTISPSYIENALRASPYVAEAVVFGHGRKYLTAVIEIDFDTVADWARSNNVGYTGFTSLTAHPQIERLMRGEIDRINRDLARVEQIKSFRILPKALDPEEEGEPVTPTRKVKRKLMYERFRDLVDGMYDDSEERLIAAGAGDVKF